MRRNLLSLLAMCVVLSLAMSVSPLATTAASAATWTQIATGGIGNLNNIISCPAAEYQGKLMMGTFFAPPWLPNVGEVSLNTYDGTTFATVPTDTLPNHANIKAFNPTASHDGLQYIGTYNHNFGGELFTWGGSGNPVQVAQSAGGWGDTENYTTVPLGEINGELVVCTGNDTAGLNMYKSGTGSSWTKIVGSGTSYPSGFGNANNELAVMLNGEDNIYRGDMIIPVQNTTNGLSVYSYDGTSFTLIGSPSATPDAHHWGASQKFGGAVVSHVDDRVYLGTVSLGASGEIWSWNGTRWDKVAGNGIDDLGNFGLMPLVRGADLYAAAWNQGSGCRIYKRTGSTFAPISPRNMSGSGSDNIAAILKTYNGRMLAGTGNNSGSRVFSTPMGPSIDYLVPSSGPQGTILSIRGHDFLVARGNGRVSINGVSPEQIVSWSDTEIVAVVPPTATTGPVTVTTGLGTSNPVTFTVVPSTWYLAEGTTAWGFDTYISIMNANPSAVTARVTYMPTGGANVVVNVPLPANSQTTVNPRDSLGDMDFSTKVEATDKTKPIAVDRTMSWTGPGAAGPEGHSSVGVTAPAKTWYLPEGSSEWGFECWLLIQNPNSGTATCTVTYMIEGGDPVTKVKKVSGNSRETYNMFEDIGNRDASIRVTSDIPVIPERAMYRNNRREGHDSIGTTAPAQDFYLAEGTSAWGFTSYVLVQNPNASAVDVTVTYMTGEGPKPQAPFSMPANSRKTIRVNYALPNTDFSTQVHGSKAIIAERAMYWDNGTGEACHDSIGMSSPHMTFYLPDGQTSDGRETWTLVQNPNGTPVKVTISYLLAGGGTPVSRTESIPANTRKTYNMAEHSGINGRAAIMVTSKTTGMRIMVERAMYWNTRGAGTDTIGGYSY